MSVVLPGRGSSGHQRNHAAGIRGFSTSVPRQENLRERIGVADIAESGSSAGQTQIAVLNPLEEPGWDALVETHPENSFFHSCAWARVLQETYGHRPTYFCCVSDRKLVGLLPVMEVCSPLFGRRAISLPFTDFCHPLPAARELNWDPYELAKQRGQRRAWRYLECRGGVVRWNGSSTSLAFYGHFIELGKSIDLLFKGMTGPVRRGIKRAQASNLRVEFSQQMEAVRSFYALHCMTRRRHGLPPQPVRFFESLARHILAADKGVVVSAFLGKQPVASAIFFYQGSEAVFKFGASDYAFQSLRPNNLVMWEAIKWLRQRGLQVLHLGRTSLSNAGLRRFKRGFGAMEERIEYARYDFKQRRFVSDCDRSATPASRFLRLLPASTLRQLGNLLYPHMT